MIDLSTAVFTEHAAREMRRRDVAEEDVREALRRPEGVRTVRPGRSVAQRLFLRGEPSRSYLLRVFVDIDRTPPEIVTVLLDESDREVPEPHMNVIYDARTDTLSIELAPGAVAESDETSRA